MAKKVMKIEPVRQKVIQQLRPKKRVCAYCRVSTDSAKQHTSYVVQVEYYKAYIENGKIGNLPEFSRMKQKAERRSGNEKSSCG